MPLVVLPQKRGEEALKEALRLAARLRRELGIKFNRDADDVYQALLGVLLGVEEVLRTKDLFTGLKKVVEEKGEKTEGGTYIWPGHLKTAAKELGVEWEELKRILKESDIISYDRKKKKYLIKEI